MAGEKKAGKRKGLGGLSPEKKKLLKQLIMQKAAEDMKKKQAEEAASKKKIIDERVPKLEVAGLSQADLEKKVKELYNLVCRLEEEKYEWEAKIHGQELEKQCPPPALPSSIVYPLQKAFTDYVSILPDYDPAHETIHSFTDHRSHGGRADLERKVKSLYDTVCRLEEDKYDWEVKIGRQDFEINELSIKVNDIKGKFVKPVLKKVSKTESKLAKFDKKSLKSKLGFRDQLKSTGQSKFALEDEDKDKSAKKPDWGQDALKKHEEEEKEAAEEGGEAEEEEEEEEEE